jgi:serine/threonine protein kinase/Flp pilus assembly protein TadD
MAIESAVPAPSPARESETIVDSAGSFSPGAAVTAGGSPLDPLAALAPGNVLAGRYEIEAVLGEGGMGAVYKAKDLELDRIVALKLIRPELASRADIVLRFKHELILARQITHKNVVRIFDFTLAEGRKFITMQYVEGHDLYSRIVKQGKLPLHEAVSIFRQALLGLQAAHEEGVVHRDLKPHNIMVDATGRACLMDFGIASSVETSGMTRTGVLMGTPDYMSPEQVRGERAEVRSDLFCMGVIFFEMLTGKLPYPATNSIATLIRRTREKAPLARDIDPSIPDYLSEIVARCLEIDINQRYSSAGEILTDLDARQISRAPRADAAGQASAALKPGLPLGSRYRIEGLLGEGGMGTVYKAWDSEVGRMVALKLVRPELAAKASYLEKLKQEILLASRISHRNILRIHDLGQVDDVRFISMAYIDGQDLSQLLRDTGRLPVDRALAFGKQMAQALEAAHAEGVVHRDLKPQNILVNQDDQSFISDFGLATSLQGEASAETLGTPQYMAPEQVENGPIDNRTDIYALGLILYEMVTGSLPFASDTVMQTMFQRVANAPRNPRLLNPDLPDDLVAVILKCLEKEPEKRYQHAGDVFTALQSIRTEPATPPTAPSRWPGILAAGVVALLVLLAALPQTRHAALSLIGRGPKAAANPAQARYVAVIPFRVEGDDPALSLAADGLVESLSARLSQLQDVHLASQTAAARVNPTDPLAQIAQSLGAKLIVQGQVSGSGDKVQIVMSVNEPATGRRLWTKQFSGLRQDILTVQNEIYNQLVAALDIKPSSEDLARGASRLTEDVGAYSLYLEGRNVLRGKRDEKNLTKALDLFKSATDKDPSFTLAYTGLADASLYMYDLTKDGVWTNRALGAANHAQQLNDKLPEVHFALGSVYNATGKTGESIAELKQALDLAPNSDEAYRRMGRAYLNAGRKDDAIKSFQKAIDANPYYWLNHNLLGIAFVQSGNNESALKSFRKVTELDPKRASGWSNIGSIDHNLGKWEESAAMFKKAVDLDPSADNYSNLGAGVFFLGRCDEARTYYQKAVDLNPDQTALGNLAGAYRCLGQQSQAAIYYQEAIDKGLLVLQVNPKDAATLGLLGTDYAKKGDFRRGLDFARRAMGLDPDDAQIVYQNAVVYALKGDKPQALDLLAKAIQKGFSKKEAAIDPDMKNLSSEAGFQKLIE